MAATLTVRLPADCEESVLREKLDALGDTKKVRELTLTNCILANTGELRRCISFCHELRTLTCLSVPFKPNDLVRLLLGPLQHLTRLEFSLLESDEEVAAEVDTIEAVKEGKQHQSAPNLRHMYVEVLSEKNFALLSALIPVCPNLSHLHVHVLRGYLEPAIIKCSDILLKHEHITLFMLTSEVQSRSECEPPPALDMDSCAKVCGNVMQTRPPSSWNVLRLRDLAAAQNQEGMHHTDPITVVTSDRTVTPNEFVAAGERNRWDDVHHICVVLLSTQTTSSYPVAEYVYRMPLRSFFNHFKSLVELNVNSFHCGNTFDMTDVLAVDPFKVLRALSIAPCGLRRDGALRRLASACPKLEDLDIRIRRGGRYESCVVCQHNNAFDPDDVEYLQENSELMRITLAHVPDVQSYMFFHSLRVAELRLINSPCVHNKEYMGLGAMLAANERLRCFVLVDDELKFGQPALKGTLQEVQMLRYLVLVSQIAVSVGEAVPYCHELTLGLPRLETMHVHYKDTEGVERRMTWLRRAEAQEELQGAGEVPPHVPRGRLLHSRPCVICSTETFIGLVKPHNRGARTCF